MLKRLFGDNEAERAARALYDDLVAHARSEVFFREFAAPDTVEGRFEIVALHAWMTLRRLRGEAAARLVSQRLMETMFADFDASLRELGVGDLAIGRKVRTLAENFFGRVEAYDAAIAATAPDALAAALSRNVYGAHDAPRAADLAAYARAALRELDAQPTARLAKGVARFPAPAVSEGRPA